MNKINLNNTCYFGSGSISNLSNEIMSNAFKSAFVITDDKIIESGVYSKVLGELLKCKIFATLFSDITSGPKVSEVKNAYAAYKKSKADFILAIGGGSVLDCAKAVSFIAKNEKFVDVVSLAGKKINYNKPIPVIAIPTTSSSGAEISNSIVLSDEFRNKKIICFADKVLPIAVISDANLMTTVPDLTTLSYGFDALTHAIESLISKNATLFTKSLANDAIKIIVKTLPKCYDEPDNIEARENMAYGAYMASLAYSNSGLGICHSLAHAVQDKIDIPHGIALAILLPATLKFNMYSSKSAEYKYISEAFGVMTDGLTHDQICRSALKELEKFRNDFNIPKKLSDYGLKETQLDIVALNAFEDACTTENPRECNTTDLYLILKKLI